MTGHIALGGGWSAWDSSDTVFASRDDGAVCVWRDERRRNSKWHVFAGNYAGDDRLTSRPLPTREAAIAAADRIMPRGYRRAVVTFPAHLSPAAIGDVVVALESLVGLARAGILPKKGSRTVAAAEAALRRAGIK